MKLNGFAAIAALTLCLGALEAASAEELRIGMAAPEPTPWGDVTKKFAAKVAELTDGELTVAIYHNNELGDEQTMARQLARGRLDMAVLSNVASSLLVPEYGLLLSPYTFDSQAQADCVVANNFTDTFGEAFENAGAILLSTVDVGYMTIMSKSPIHTPADLENVKIRTSPTMSDTYFVQAAGGAAVPLGTADSMPALKTGQVTALTTPVVIGVAGGYAAEAPKVTRTNHGLQIGAMLISKKKWDSLPAEWRSALTEAAKVMSELGPVMRETEDKLLQKVVASGGEVYELSPEELAEWKRVAEPAREKIVAETGGDSEAVWAALEAAKSACGQ